jgi:hypothetical protein
MADMLSALRAGRRFTPRKHLSASDMYLCQMAIKPQGLLQLEGLNKLI